MLCVCEGAFSEELALNHVNGAKARAMPLVFLGPS